MNERKLNKTLLRATDILMVVAAVFGAMMIATQIVIKVAEAREVQTVEYRK